MAVWMHQDEAIAWGWGRRGIIWHHGMGSGKTRTALEFIRRWLAEHGGSRILVCCPKAVIAAWLKQAGLWAPDIRIVALTKGTAKDKAKLLQAEFANPSPLIVVCNYESVWRIKEIEKQPWDFLVWDEVHRLKSPTGVASRWAGRMCQKNAKAKRLGLTGTLIPHSVLDLQPIYRAIESPECETFGASYTLHKARYAVIAAGQNWVVGYKNLADAHAKVASTTHRVKTTDVIDLPPIQKIDIPCDLSPAEGRIYSEIEREFCAVVDSGTVTPKNALEQLLRLQQVCGGFVRFDDEPAARQICEHPAKASVLADMLEDLPVDEPVVVFCRFKSDLAATIAAAQARGRVASELSGAKDELADFQAGRSSLLAAQIQSGGIGIDLTRASYAFFFSLGYSLAEYEQAVARLHRPGQERKTTIYHLVATINGRSTVDGAVYRALQERREVVDAIVAGYAGRSRSSAGAR